MTSGTTKITSKPLCWDSNIACRVWSCLRVTFRDAKLEGRILYHWKDHAQINKSRHLATLHQPLTYWKLKTSKDNTSFAAWMILSTPSLKQGLHESLTALNHHTDTQDHRFPTSISKSLKHEGKRADSAGGKAKGKLTDKSMKIGCLKCSWHNHKLFIQHYNCAAVTQGWYFEHIGF